jgi:hypothetical protein
MAPSCGFHERTRQDDQSQVCHAHAQDTSTRSPTDVPQQPIVKIERGQAASVMAAAAAAVSTSSTPLTWGNDGAKMARKLTESGGMYGDLPADGAPHVSAFESR